MLSSELDIMNSPHAGELPQHTPLPLFNLSEGLPVSRVVAPEDSGFTADYYTDGDQDEVQIQAAIDALTAENPDGGIIHLKKGNYYLGSTVTLNNYITLQGEGREVTVVHLSDSVNADMFYTPLASSRWSYITIKNMAIDGNRTGNSTGHIINLNSCWKATIQDVVLKHAAKSGLVLGGTGTLPNLTTLEVFISDVFIVDSGEEGFKQGWTFDTNGYNIYIDGTIANSGAKFESGSSTFHHLHVFDADEHGIYITSTASECVFIQCVGDTNNWAGIRLDGNRHILIGCESFNSSRGLVDDHSGIDVTGLYNTVIGGHFWDKQSSPSNQKQKYGIEERSGSLADYNLYSLNNLVQNHIGALRLEGSNSKVFQNMGYVTEASGTGTIASGATLAVVTHGLSVTPTIDDISITLGELSSNDPGQIYVNTITSTQFTVNCRNDPGASNLDFAWRVTTL